MIKLSIGLLLVTVIVGCAPKRLQIAGQFDAQTGLIQQQVDITQGEHHWLWVCYSELKDHQIIGFSCQNDTAMPLFSGGIVNGTFEFEYISKLLLKIKPERMLEYIKMSIYRPGHLTDAKQQKRFIVSRNSKHTDISDLRKNMSVRLTTL